MPDLDMIPNVAGAVRDGLENTLMSNVNGIINLAISRVIETFMGESKEDKKKELDAYYDKIQQIADGSAASRQQNMSPRERVMEDLNRVDELVVNSMTSLKEARDKSHCGVCRSSLDEALREVEERAIPVLAATDKVRAMQTLKSEGRLPPTAMWDELDPEQKDLVEGIANQITQSKVMSLRPIGFGEEEDVEDEYVARRASPKPSKRRKARKKATKKARTSRRKKGN